MLFDQTSLPEKILDPIGCWLESVGDLLSEDRRNIYIECIHSASAQSPDWSSEMFGLVRAQFSTPAILAAELYRHSVTEGIGAKTIEHISRTCGGGPLSQEMLLHAADETRHSKMFNALARHLQPFSGDFADLEKENDDFIDGFQGDVEWFLCDAHVAELRNLEILSYYVRASYEHQADQYVIKSFERIFEDEWNHVTYTVKYVGSVLARSMADQSEFIETMIHYASENIAQASRMKNEMTKTLQRA